MKMFETGGRSPALCLSSQVHNSSTSAGRSQLFGQKRNFSGHIFLRLRTYQTHKCHISPTLNPPSRLHDSALQHCFRRFPTHSTPLLYYNFSNYYTWILLHTSSLVSDCTVPRFESPSFPVFEFQQSHLSRSSQVMPSVCSSRKAKAIFTLS